MMITSLLLMMWSLVHGPNLPEDDFIQHEDLPYCIGEFVWTGFDYLGETDSLLYRIGPVILHYLELSI